MKKMISTLAVLMLALGVACANADRPIKAEELPAAAQTFIKTHFPNAKVSIAKIDEEFFMKDYEVMLTDGTKLEFNGRGEWIDVDCKYSAVPDTIIPEQIREYVKASYPDVAILKIEHGRKLYEVSLSNRLELKFDKQYNLVAIDD